MTVYTTVPLDDSNLDVTVTESNDLVYIDINPAAFATIGVSKEYVDGRDAVTLSSANTYTDTSIAAIPAVDLSSYETIVNSNAGDATTLSSANTYTDTSIAAIPATDLSAYSTTVQVEALPVSTFTNDAGYITTETDSQTLSFATPNISISGGNSVDLTPLTLGYITADSTNTLTNKSGAISQWTNDSAYLTASALTPYSTSVQVAALPVSTFTNDSAYLTGSALTPYSTTVQVAALPVSTFTNDAGYSTTTGTVTPSSTDTFTNKSGAISQWTNDSAYLTGSALTPYSTTVQVEALPVSTFTNDAGYITSSTDSQTLSFANPNLTISNGNAVDLSSLTPTVPVTSVNTLIGAVVLDTDDVLEGTTNLYHTTPRVQAVINTNTAGYATTTYVDTEDATTLSSANTYTDTSIAAIPATDLSAYSTTVQVAALPVSTFTNDSGYSTTTYVDTNDATTLSSANTYTDTSIAAIDLANLSDVVTIDPDSSGMTIGATGVTTAKWGSSAPLFWRSDSDDGALKNFVFDNTGQNIFVGMHWKTADSNKKLFRFDATSSGGTDPGDGSHSTNFVLSGTNNIFKSRFQNESRTGLEFDAQDINLSTTDGVSINDNYTFPNVDGNQDQVMSTNGNGIVSWVNSGAVAVTSAPTLTGNTDAYRNINYNLTVSNHDNYDNPTYVFGVYDSSSNQVLNNDDFTRISDDTFQFIPPNTSTGTVYDIKVKCQDFGSGQSVTTTKSVTLAVAQARYWRLMNFSGKSIQVGSYPAAVPEIDKGTHDAGTWIDLFALYSQPNQYSVATGGLVMTSNTLPTGYVASDNYHYSDWEAWKAFDNNSSNHWGNYGTTALSSDYLQIDLGTGSSNTTKTGFSFRIRTKNYANEKVDIAMSSTGAFTGEETIITTVFLKPNYDNNIG